MSAPKTEITAQSSKQAWQTPSIRSAGTVGEILRSGDNKVSAIAGDPGEPRKIPGTDK